ncbi:RidA family protein (plasmid) [Leisingera aquaemixtae]|jgi:enamine deaminase RidA (YjgF/YER057c/UK114 family)|uniref:RidA family protein n=1 Tax=Leisingera aquaemixtae TaxID=1396826 RepID=A0ABY5WQ70_9RHOB|nr:MULTISPECIES: RidA family protein [Leisingera]QDI74289.1 RidA family protein [Leisingera aquaemixtae]UWQ27006.1 RidA family protein [Leisingera aquaemixtae]UWQ39723.1 RidA family protein [Leisingera aquaemixtae]UWQ43544.1 RidA family protein [Leisingera aquaemixtae]UWQ47906.1 RidA family protein [Leisingera aquaemixtae]
MNSIEKNLQSVGVKLPEAPRPLGNFAPYLVDGEFLYISGQISIAPDGRVIQGKLGQDIEIEQGIEAARCCGIGILARAKAAIGDLDKIERLIKLGAFVNSVPDFTGHPKVVNGASDFMVQALGPEKANHVRFAVGSPSLPSNAAVEIEALFRIRPGP